MRWTIPTLIQQLVDQGVTIRDAGTIVGLTYPQTAGDTFYRWADPDDPEKVAVGVYAIWNSLRGDQSPLSGAKVSDDARTIAQFVRLDPRDLSKIVRLSDRYDDAVSTVVARTADAMRAGDYFEPVAIEPDPMLGDRVADLHRSVARLDGIGDYIRDIPHPNFGG